MNKKLRQALTAVLCLILIVCLGYLGWKMLDYRRGADSYDSAVKVVEFPELPESAPLPEELPEGEEDPYAAALAEMDLQALREVNDEVLGWITIPGTGLSYPLLQSEDNNYYLTHTWTKDKSSVGAIFLDRRSTGDLSGFNTVIYGHRMRNGTMFASLKYYNKPDYWQEHPDVYIVNDSGVSRYRIFAAHEAGVQTVVYHFDITEETEKQEFIQYALDHSVIDTGITPEVGDKIITLSTCTGRGYATRWVVQAVLVG